MTDFAPQSSPDISNIADPLKAAADKAMAAGRDVQSAAVDLASSSKDMLKDHADEFVGAAKDVASQAGEQIQKKMMEQKNAGADYVNDVADTVRRAAAEFDSSVPMAGEYIRKAATQIDGAAQALREGDFNGLIEGAKTFARNQPTAFLGLAVLAGFGVVRFLKSSGSDNQSVDYSDRHSMKTAAQETFAD